MSLALRPFVRGLALDERGTALIEGAFALPLLALLMLGMTDMSRAVALQQGLEENASRALERVAAVGNANSDFATVKADAAAAAGVPADSVTLERWLECNGVKQTSYDTVCTTGQQYARLVSISIRNTYTPLFDYGLMKTMYKTSTLGSPIVMDGDALVRIQ